MPTPRFDLYVKKAADGGTNGTCPFSQRAYMFLLLKVGEDQLHVNPVDLQNKPDYFLKMNPSGKVPVLIDHGAEDKVVPDSGDIVEYIDKLFPEKNLQVGYKGPAFDATCNCFGKFAAMMRNQDRAESPRVKEEFRAELKKLNDFLKSDAHGSNRFLIGDKLTELDCTMLPRVNQCKLAGKYWKSLDVEKEFPEVCKYLANADGEMVWKITRPTNQDVCEAWGNHSPPPFKE